MSSTEEKNNANTLPQEPSDLSGLVVEGSGLSGLVVETSSATTSTADLSGLAMGDLSGLAATSEPSVGTLPEAGVSSEIAEDVRLGMGPDIQAPVAPQTSPEQPIAGMAPDIQAPVASSFPNDFASPASPQTTAAPIYTTSTPSFQGGFDPATGAYTTAPAAAPVYVPPVPTAPPPPRPVPIQIDQAPAAVVNALSAFGQTATPDKFTPKDELPTASGELVVKEVTLAERDDDITRQVMEYIGPERRDKLFTEIEMLYGLVSDKFSGTKTDVNFALDTLRQAHGLILENPREYDEAFYRVAIVKTILNRKMQLSRWSYSWGLFVLLYGIIWLVICMVGGYYLVNNTNALLVDRSLSLSFQALFSAFAGGIGGSVAVLWVLYYRVSIKQDFDRQYLMFYLVKPILGYVLGLVMFFLLIAASSIGASGGLELGFETATGVSLAGFTGFVAGFRQDNVYDWIYTIIKTISPKAAEESQSKTSLVPHDVVKDEEVKQVKVSVS